MVAYFVLVEFVSYFPCEYGRILGLVLAYFLDNERSSHTRFAAADGSRLNAASLIVAAEYFAYLINISQVNFLFLLVNLVYSNSWKKIHLWTKKMSRLEKKAAEPENGD